MTKIFAHRGSKGTHPENTLPAFREAVRVGADGIELDVQLTKDQELVVIHDNDVDRTTDGTGEITDFTLSEIKQLDAGSWFKPEFSGERIPTFVEVLTCLQEEGFTGILNIEVKTDEKEYPGIEAKVIECLNQQEWSFQVAYSSFNFSTLENLAELDPTREICHIMYAKQSEIEMVKHVPFISGVHPKITWIQENPEQAATYPLPLRPWTVNQVGDMLLAFELGLAAIHTDYPEQAKVLLKSYQER